jgi:hypothetical protein
MSRIAYWLCRLFGTVPCRACYHPGRAHEAADRHRVLPACLMCAEYADRLREGGYGSTSWREVLVKAIHSYRPEPYR